MRKEKSRDAARSRRSKENHEFYELAKLLPLPAAITSQLVNGIPPWAPDFTTLGSVNPYSSHSLTNYADQQLYSSDIDKPSIEATNSRQISCKPPATSSINRHHGHAQSTSSVAPSTVAFQPSQINSYGRQQQYQTAGSCFEDESLMLTCDGNDLTKTTASLFEVHQGTHILQSLDGFAFAIGRDGKFLYVSETVSMYLGLSQVEMTGSSVFDYTHQQDHEELAEHLGIQYPPPADNSVGDVNSATCDSPQPASVHSQYSAASNETSVDDYVNLSSGSRKRAKLNQPLGLKGHIDRNGKRNNRQQQRSPNFNAGSKRSGLRPIDTPDQAEDVSPEGDTEGHAGSTASNGTSDKNSYEPGSKAINRDQSRTDPWVRQFCIRMKSTLTKRGCQHFKSSGYRVVHVIAHLRAYQSNDHGHLMDPLDNPTNGRPRNQANTNIGSQKQIHPAAPKRRGVKLAKDQLGSKEAGKMSSAKLETGELTGCDTNSRCGSSDGPPKIIGMVAIAIALPPPSINELRLESDTFVLRLGLDLKVTHIDPKMTDLLHFPVELLAGRSLYTFIHPADVRHVQRCHSDLLKKGQMMSGYYRLLARHGGYIWVQTCATLICNNVLNGPANVANLPSVNEGQLSESSSNYIQRVSGFSGSPSLPIDYQSSNRQQYASQANVVRSKMVSPSTSSHISSTYDNLDQDQCVIFVNYMITNTVEGHQTIDVCQNSDFSPITNPFSGTNHTTSSNLLYSSHSSSSTCSSPCLGSLKTNTNYAATSTQSININASPRQHKTAREPRASGGSSRLAGNGGIGKSLSNKSNSHVMYPSPKCEDNLISPTTATNFNTSTSKLAGQSPRSNHHLSSLGLSSDIASGSATGNNYASYSYATTDSVNLALNNNNNNKSSSDSAWLAHHQFNHQHQRADTDGQTLSNAHHQAPTMVYGANPMVGVAASEHYGSMNRSIYKAAFGINMGKAVQGYGHQHQHHSQQTAGSYGGANPIYQSAATNPLDSATAAAVVAASNLTGHSHHHHHHHNHNSTHYSHIDPHHQANASSHHGTTAAASSYYNYYGYYGNKFI